MIMRIIINKEIIEINIISKDSGNTITTHTLVLEVMS